MSANRVSHSRADSKPVSRPVPARLLDDIQEHIADRHSTLTDDQRLIIALWIISTAFYQEFRYIFYLHIAAQDTNAGKTEIANILVDLCYKAMLLDPTVASLSIFRKSGMHTAVIDEIQLLLTARSTDQDAFNRLVNHGTRPGIAWQVSDKDGINGVDNRDIAFPKIFLGTNPGILRQALAERCHQIIVTSGTVADQYERARRQRIRPVRETACRLQAEIARLADSKTIRETIRARAVDIEPMVITDDVTLINRPLDRWQPLIIIADLVSDEYGKRIRSIIAEQEVTEPEYIPSIAESIDSALLKVSRERRLTFVSWYGEHKSPLPPGDFMLSNADLGYPVPRGPVRNRLPKGSMIFNSGTISAEIRFRAKEFAEICAGIGWKPAEVKQAYKRANRLHAQEGRTSIPLPFIQGQPKTSVIAIDVSRWFWPDAPQGNAMEKSVERILINDDPWEAE
jgi:hypothetical protein